MPMPIENGNIVIVRSPTIKANYKKNTRSLYRKQ